MKRFLKYIQGHEIAYLVVWGALLVLTFLTVWVSYHNFGIFNIVVAMGVATIKGSLVCLYFMHLKYDNKVNQVVFVSAFVFLAIFSGLTGSDVFLRNPVTSSKLKLAQAVPPSKIEHEKDFGRITPELVKRGGDLFKVHCMSCHTPEKSFKSDTSQKVYEMIVPGVHGGSPHSFSDLGEKERWALVHYIESLRK